MVPLPKPRGFWDYALLALVMTGLLMFLFWPGASDAVGWTDATLALAAAVLFVLAVVFARRAERAAWIARPPSYVSLCVTAPTDIRRYSVRKTATHSSEPNPIEPIPFGRGGAGLYTAHPVGLVVVVGVLLMGLWALPEARWFLAGAVLLGGIWGYFLWLRHR